MAEKAKPQSVIVKARNLILNWSDSEKTSIWAGREYRNEKTGATSTKWGCQFRFLKSDTELLAEIKAAIRKSAEASWPGQADKMVAFLVQQNKSCLVDGDANPLLERNHGFWLLSANMTRKPDVYVHNRNTPGTPVTVYDGCVVNAVLEFWCCDNTWGQRLSLSCPAIIKVADGVAFGGGGSSVRPEDLDDLSVPDDEKAGGSDDVSW